MNKRIMVVVAAVLLLSHAAAAQTATRGTFTTSAPASCSDRIRVDGLTISPTNPNIGDPVTVSMVIRHVCASGDPLNIRWSLWVDGYEIAQGTSTVAANTSATVSKIWTAEGGARRFHGDIDPSRAISDSTQSNNSSQTVNVTINTDWNAVRAKGQESLKHSLNVWNSNARLRDVVINGPAASGGKIAASPLYDTLRSHMINAGIPAGVTTPIASALSEQWKRWSDSVRVVNPAWYPAFALVPASRAPNTLNVPSPLASLQQDGSPLQSGTIASAINGKLGNMASLSGAGSAVQELSNVMAQCYATLLTGQVTNVWGSGNVPTFSPPAVPLGPVVDGRGHQSVSLVSHGC